MTLTSRRPQDLTFVHIGNPDLMPDGCINFAKRWQQFNILDNMKRFKKAGFSIIPRRSCLLRTVSTPFSLV